MHMESNSSKIFVSHRKAYVPKSELVVGKLYNATCIAINAYGSFFELENTDRSGLLHKYEMSRERREGLEARDVFELGDKAKVIVVDDGSVSGRVSLSTKLLEVKAGDMLRNKEAVFQGAEERYAAMKSGEKPKVRIGELHDAKCTKITEYGAFVSLSNGLSGLIHVSQMSSAKVHSVSAVFKEGDPLKVVVLDDGAVSGRLSFSTKLLEQSPGDIIVDAATVFENAEKLWKDQGMQQKFLSDIVSRKRGSGHDLRWTRVRGSQLLKSPHVDSELLSHVVGEEVVDSEGSEQLESLLEELVAEDQVTAPQEGEEEQQQEFDFSQLDDINDDLGEEEEEDLR